MKYERLTIRHPNSNYIGITETKQLPQTRESNIIINRLAELEDKIENGTLLELPCKVGDTVFAIVGKSVQEFEVYFIKIIKNKIRLVNYDYIGFTWGEEVFLTKAEAEQKLKWDSNRTALFELHCRIKY
jgi:hypothetical protein